MLYCSKCGREYPDEFLRCPICNEPLQLPYLKGEIERGKRVWERYLEFFPFPLSLRYSLGEGDTPLVYLPNLSKQLNVELYVKNETVNPTWSFKDRGTFTAINYAISSGYKYVGTVSTGNMGASVAAYSSHACVKSFVLLSEDIPQEKLLPIGVYGAKMIKVRGDYGELYYRSIEIGKKLGIYFINSDNPYRVEGYKSISFEIAEELQPDYVVIPTSSGGLFSGIYKGFYELKKSNIIEDMPKLVCAQALGCSPIYTALKEERENIERFENPETIAKAIKNPYPPSGNRVLRILKEGHLCEAVTDEEILKAQKELAQEGLFVQPASATSLAVVQKLVSENKIEEKSVVVLILTGAGIKTTTSYLPFSTLTCGLDNLSSCLIENL